MINTGQMLLVLGAMVIFSLLLPSLNETILYNDATLISANAEITAVSLAEKVIAEASTRLFDEICVTTRPEKKDELTAITSFGPDAGESYPIFDDVDDYHGLTLTDSTTFPSVVFNISCQVTYVSPDNPEDDITGEQFLKRLYVNVTSPYLVNPASGQSFTISMQQIFAFY